MKFTSTKLDKNCVLSMNVIFDTDLLGSIKKEEDGFYSASYGMNEGGVSQESLFPIVETLFVIHLTRNNVFLSAVVYVDEDDDAVKAYTPYITDGMIEFNVHLTDEERTRLLLAIIKSNS